MARTITRAALGILLTTLILIGGTMLTYQCAVWNLGWLAWLTFAITCAGTICGAILTIHHA